MFRTVRESQYFIERDTFEEPTRAVVERIAGERTVGLLLNEDDWEHPLRVFAPAVRLVHVREKAPEMPRLLVVTKPDPPHWLFRDYRSVADVGGRLTEWERNH